MTRHRTSQPDPAESAAALMQRLGFLTLMFLLPVMSILSRRAGVVLLPTGVAFLCVAVLIARKRPSLEPLRAILVSGPALCGLLILAWCAISLVWTVHPEDAASRLLRLTLTLALLAAGFCAMPERVRAANLYLLPIGTALAAGAALLAALLVEPPAPITGYDAFERGLIVLVIFLWPAAAWLRSRGRIFGALLLVAMAAIAIILGFRNIAIASLATGGIVFAFAVFTPKAASWALAGAMAGILALAPLLPFAVAFLTDSSGFGNAAASLNVWRDIVLSDPLRLITGHGLETALYSPESSALPVGTPRTVLFEVWYELGVVGAFAAAALSLLVVLSIGNRPSAMAPGELATIASAFTCGVLGISSAQSWWFTTLAAAALILIAAERSQFRTQRPPVILKEEAELSSGG